MNQILLLIKETALQIAKYQKNEIDEKGYLIGLKDLHDEIDTYLNIYKQIEIMRATNGLRDEPN
jgi:hypothetical protein